MSFEAISIEGLSHRFLSKSRAPTVALSDVSLQFPAGKVTSIVGPSGCGKSTLLLIMRGLVKASEGEVRFLYGDGKGEPTAGGPPRMATVWQSFNLLPWRTVIDNVAFGLELTGVPLEERRAKAMAAIRAVELSGFEQHYPGQLSGGMKQRVGLARGIVMSPDILFLDEPFGALDAQTRLYLQEQLSTLVEQSAKTIILITHSIEEAIFLGDRVVVMTARPGRVAATLDIDLPRPRNFEVQKQKSFSDLFSEIYGLLRDEVRKSMLN
ncbi:ABC transporter ATP-binding protein [Bradyrhizobium sp. NP1]|jgi:NitT/TauT family transport system ATP-binding protein|uniref:ABC transporter ATP-binding protein n=1 Tax=Bradyrhizobium sp. NP1 TaxID=3049772 RepID=UPI0025A656F1|nr:ABC transporter ATP-binding protein [Bradyrhizobium sp. NP1]WJR80009.1 ABC transporter ATP-binding protein [Bradyrhizobium sp. NP1]